eukprot:Plantae.Rhodophyta-Purpureofilum_apyrenoidigerum.ctg58570.p1 GENE.Plantae.Rhodophyta-Purpureofilum_apyrenoidigerum.ctg58570~~Plantae.Rhodophyta-Purpureofilum_apyrenoidigerum.ctg58570.p1  ORF type:complete len:119 (-),score=14.18 Plantae.Rhodophyta-Purpureofilum_apyrenoidigerum.ctg58570:62-418(-)
MASLTISTNVRIDDLAQSKVLRVGAEILQSLVGAPERMCMVSYDHAAGIVSNEDGPCAFVRVVCCRALERHINKQITQRLADAVQEICGIQKDRHCIEFVDLRPDNLGHDGDLLTDLF